MWIVIFLFSACRKDDVSDSSVDLFYKNMTSVELEVAYEEGANPYTINLSGENVWKFTELNIESLFIRRPVALDVIIPDGLGEMTIIPDQNKAGYTVDNILGLANHYRKSEGDEITGNIFILFLDGYFIQDDTLRENIMGIHITGTTVIAVFKPLISSMFIGIAVKEFTEQSVVIHEIGHTLGLVNHGLPMVTPHHDAAHKAHCTNSDCVMYWANEGIDISFFVQNYLGTNKKLIFGQECVADVTAYMP